LLLCKAYIIVTCSLLAIIPIDEPFHPYRPVWYVPDQGMDYTIADT